MLKLAALTAITVSTVLSPLVISAESGIVPEKEAVFKGEDTCIAILDRGFALEHESLIITDSTPKLSKRKSDELFKNTAAYKELSKKSGETRQKIFKKEKRLSVYVNEKIPFAYDYGDNDTDLSGAFSSHGMAMISVAAGTDTLYGKTAAIQSGTAPEAQILAMKVYSDATGEVSAEAMSAAVNDAVTMGADVIYIAVTEVCGFEEKEWGDFEAALDNAWKKGVIVVSAAGDIAEYGKGNIYERLGSIYYIPTDSPDVGMVAYPSASPKVISVGSADRYEMISDFLTLGDGQAIPYSDSNFLFEIGGVKKSFAQHFEGQELEYVICDGFGTPEELAVAGDLKGKVAVVSRGEITFAEKAQNAAELGAAAVVIYDDDVFTYGALDVIMALEGAPIPAVFIESEDFKKMSSSETNTFVTNVGKSYSTSVDKSPFVSIFTPSGTTPELGLKPDVVAVGTSVRCAMPSGGYGTMSSTTAAAAKVAGICAGIKEYLLDSGEKFTELTLADRVRSLLVNSASILEDTAVKELYSPRKQGGGLVSLDEAVSTELLLTYNGNFKAELGDGYSDVIEFEVTATNLSDSEKECSFDCTVGSDGYTQLSYEELESVAAESILGDSRFEPTNEKINLITHYVALEDVDTYIDGNVCRINTEAADYQPHTFTLGALESRIFKVKLVIGEGTYNTYNEIFTNGFFTEGFLRLSCEDDISAVPFIAFCGDFGKAESIDTEIYSEDAALFDSCYLYHSSVQNGVFRIVGEINTDKDTDYDKSSMVFSPKANPYSVIGINLGLRRSVKELAITVTNENGEVISEQRHENVSRSYVSVFSGSMITPDYLIWNGRAADNRGYIYEDGVYNITVTYKRVAEDEEKSFTYRIFIDSTAPKVSAAGFEERGGKEYMKLHVEENHRIASATVFDSRFKEADISSDWLADISEMTGEYIYAEVIDQAGNKSVIRVDNPNYR